MTPDFIHAREYAHQRLQRELAPHLRYHSLAHTFDDVLPAARRLAVLEGVNGEELLLLSTAACYHDIGFVEQRTDHELISVRIAIEILPRFGYSNAQITLICGMIMATKIPQTPHTLLEQLLADADLDSLGRDDFLSRSYDLRAELAVFEDPMTDAAWYDHQIQFLSTHRYFTRAAQLLRDAQKQHNIAILRALLAAAE